MSEKVKVTGYFHDHADSMSPHHKERYRQIHRAPGFIALELWEWTRRDARRIQEISDGLKDLSSQEVIDAGYADDPNWHDRLEILSGLRKKIIMLDYPKNHPNAEQYDKTARELTAFEDNFYNEVVTGKIKSEQHIFAQMGVYREIVSDWEIQRETREDFILTRLAKEGKKLVSQHPDQQVHILLEYGALHLPGLDRGLKHNPNFDYSVILQKPLTFGFKEGVSFSYRLGRVPSDLLVARGLFEHVVFNLFSETAIKTFEERDGYESIKLLAKRLASKFSFEEIVDFFVSDADRRENQYEKKSKFDLTKTLIAYIQQSEGQAKNSSHISSFARFSGILVESEEWMRYIEHTYPRLFKD